MNNLRSIATHSRRLFAITLIAVIVLSAVACSKAEPVPNQLVGTWSIDDSAIFTITSDRKFFLIGGDYNYEIRSSSTLNETSGTIVVGSTTAEIGRFDYFISGGVITVSNGMGAFETWIRMNLTGGGVVSDLGAIPTQLVGMWNVFDLELFRITSDRKFIMSGLDFEYTIMPSSILNASSGTIVVGHSNTEFGRFNYQISDGRMTISNGTASLVDFSGMVLTK